MELCNEAFYVAQGFVLKVIKALISMIKFWTPVKTSRLKAKRLFLFYIPGGLELEAVYSNLNPNPLGHQCAKNCNVRQKASQNIPLFSKYEEEKTWRLEYFTISFVSGSKRGGIGVSKWCLQGDSIHCAGPRQVKNPTFLFTQHICKTF